MADILRGLASGWALIFGWIAPSSIATSAFALLLLPRITHLPVFRELDALTTAQAVLVMGFTSVLLGLLLHAFDTPLYRVLEGYLGWPERLQDRRVQRHRIRKNRIQAVAENETEGWRQALAYEALDRYPVDDNDLAPTRLGNAIRAFETYGTDRFNLDSLAFWSELLVSVPERLQDEYERARASVDFFVCLLYLSALFTLVAVAVALSTGPRSLLIVALISAALTPTCYRLAYTSTSPWGEATRAIVNVGRKGLAHALGLMLPATLQAEREMWGLVNEFVFYPFSEDMAKKLDKFRIPEDGHRGRNREL